MFISNVVTPLGSAELAESGLSSGVFRDGLAAYPEAEINIVTIIAAVRP